MTAGTRARITLLTDFGTTDGYVGAMRAVIAAILPDAIIDDISHDIPHGDVGSAAWCVRTHWPYWPEGTVHICVVDPGVGSARRALAVDVGGQRFVAPDNGLLSDPLRSARAEVVEISDPRFMRAEVSSTFHGRDVFAVAGAHLGRGRPLRELGPEVTDPVLLPQSHSVVSADGVRGEVVHVDRFGNLVTNIAGSQLHGAGRVVLPERNGQSIRVARTYADVEPGELVALVGSAGLLEIAVRDGSAAERLGAGPGLVVTADAEPELRNVRS